VPPGRGDAVGDLLLAQPAQEFDRAWERPAFRQELAKELAVTGLYPAGVMVIERLSDLAGYRAGEQATAHADAPVDLPAIDRES